VKFTLEIELGNDAMQTGRDVLNALRESLKGEEPLPLETGVGGRLWDVNGNLVGKWEVTEDARAVETLRVIEQAENAVMCFAPKLAGELSGKVTALDALARLRRLVVPGDEPELPAPAVVPICPKCGSHSVLIRVDAYANYALRGWNAKGEVVAEFEEPASVTTFDDRIYMCTECGHESNWSDGEEFLPKDPDATGK
jgi:hypothetical protein